MGEKTKQSTRLISLFVTIAFSLNTFLSYSPNLYAQNPRESSGNFDSHSPKAISVSPTTVANLGLPLDLGTIEEVFEGARVQGPGSRNGKVQNAPWPLTHDPEPSKTIILIQDAHGIPDAQTSLRKLIGYLHHSTGIDLVALEGASGKIDGTFLRAYPNVDHLEEVFSEYLGRGELSGAFAAAELEDERIQYQAVEDQALYEENVDWFMQALENQPEILSDLEKLKAKLQDLKNQHYSDELLELDGKIIQWNQKSEDILELLVYLSKSNLAASFLGRYPHVRAVLSEVRDYEKELSLSIQAEIEKLAREISRSLQEKVSISEYNQQLQAYRTGALSPQKFAGYLDGLGQKAGVRAEISNRLRKLISRETFLRQMKGSRFVEEFHRFLNEIIEKQLRNNNQRALRRVDRQLHLLFKLVHFELSRQEWEELNNIRNRKYEVRGKNMISRLEDDLNSYLLHLTSKESPLVHFYELAVAREKVLSENLFRHMKQSKKNAAILIAGGFHTEGLKESLKNQNVSYVLITPSMENIPENTRYFDLMKGDVSWKNYFEVKNGRIDLEEAFNRATRDQLLQAHNRTESSRYVLKNWRDAIIRRLAEKGEIEKAHSYTRYIDEIARKKLGEARFEILQKNWLEKVDQFIEGLRVLENQNKLTPENITSLVRQATVNPRATIPVGTMLAAWVNGEASVQRSDISISGTVPERGLSPRVTVRAESRMGLPISAIFWTPSPFEKAVYDLWRALVENDRHEVDQVIKSLDESRKLVYLDVLDKTRFEEALGIGVEPNKINTIDAANDVASKLMDEIKRKGYENPPWNPLAITQIGYTIKIVVENVFQHVVPEGGKAFLLVLTDDRDLISESPDIKVFVIDSGPGMDVSMIMYGNRPAGWEPKGVGQGLRRLRENDFGDFPESWVYVSGKAMFHQMTEQILPPPFETPPKGVLFGLHMPSRAESRAEIFTTPQAAFRYLLEHPAEGTFSERVQDLAEQGRLVNPETGEPIQNLRSEALNFIFIAVALDRFFAAYRDKSRTLQTLREAIPKAPWRVTEAAAMRALVRYGKSEKVSWADLARLFGIARDEYASLSSETLERMASALERFFAGDHKKPKTLDALQEVVPQAPAQLTEATAVRTLFQHGKPKKLTWNEYTLIALVAREGYAAVGKKAFSFMASALDHFFAVYGGEQNLETIKAALPEVPRAVKRLAAKGAKAPKRSTSRHRTTSPLEKEKVIAEIATLRELLRFGRKKGIAWADLAQLLFVAREEYAVLSNIKLGHMGSAMDHFFEGYPGEEENITALQKKIPKFRGLILEPVVLNKLLTHFGREKPDRISWGDLAYLLAVARDEYLPIARQGFYRLANMLDQFFRAYLDPDQPQTIWTLQETLPKVSDDREAEEPFAVRELIELGKSEKLSWGQIIPLIAVRDPEHFPARYVEFDFIASALDRLFTDVPNEKQTLEALEAVVPEAPSVLTQGSVLRTLLAHGKPGHIKWSEFVRLIAVARPEYISVLSEEFGLRAHALDQFFAAHAGEPQTLETLQKHLPKPPENLTVAETVRELLRHGKSENDKWSLLSQLLPVAYEGYEIPEIVTVQFRGNSLDLFFAGVPNSQQTLGAVEAAVPEAPKVLTRGSALRTVIGHGKRKEMTWNALARILLVARDEYAPVAGQLLERKASALDRFYKAYSEEPEIVETLRNVIPEPPEKLDVLIVFQILIQLQKHPDLKWMDLAYVSDVAWEAYAPAVTPRLTIALNALDRQGRFASGKHKSARNYKTKHEKSLRVLAKGYFSGLEGAPATLEGLVLYFTGLALSDRLPRSARGIRVVLSDGTQSQGLGPSSFMDYLPILVPDLFFPWVTKWNQEAKDRVTRAAKAQADIGREANVQRYRLAHEATLRKLADEYFQTLQGREATLKGLVSHFRGLADSGRLPRSLQGRNSAGALGQTSGSLALSSFIAYRSGLTRDLFVPWVQEWNEKHRIRRNESRAEGRQKNIFRLSESLQEAMDELSELEAESEDGETSESKENFIRAAQIIDSKLWPLRNDPDGFIRYLKRRFGYASQTSNVGRLIRDLVQKEIGIPILLIPYRAFIEKPVDLLLLQALFPSIQHRVNGLHTIFSDELGRQKRDLIIILPKLTESRFEIFDTAAHEYEHSLSSVEAHKHYAGAENHFFRILIEGQQGRRTFERLLEWGKKKNALGRELRQTVDGFKIDWAGELLTNIFDVMHDAASEPGGGLFPSATIESFGEKLTRIYDSGKITSGYEPEKRFVEQIEHRLGDKGREILDNFFLKGSIKDLRDALGRNKFDASKEFFRVWFGTKNFSGLYGSERELAYRIAEAFILEPAQFERAQMGPLIRFVRELKSPSGFLEDWNMSGEKGPTLETVEDHLILLANRFISGDLAEQKVVNKELADLVPNILKRSESRAAESVEEVVAEVVEDLKRDYVVVLLDNEAVGLKEKTGKQSFKMEGLEITTEPIANDMLPVVEAGVLKILSKHVEWFGEKGEEVVLASFNKEKNRSRFVSMVRDLYAVEFEVGVERFEEGFYAREAFVEMPELARLFIDQPDEWGRMFSNLMIHGLVESRHRYPQFFKRSFTGEGTVQEATAVLAMEISQKLEDEAFMDPARDGHFFRWQDRLPETLSTDDVSKVLNWLLAGGEEKWRSLTTLSRWFKQHPHSFIAGMDLAININVARRSPKLFWTFVKTAALVYEKGEGIETFVSYESLHGFFSFLKWLLEKIKGKESISKAEATQYLSEFFEANDPDGFPKDGARSKVWRVELVPDEFRISDIPGLTPGEPLQIVMVADNSGTLVGQFDQPMDEKILNSILEFLSHRANHLVVHTGDVLKAITERSHEPVLRRLEGDPAHREDLWRYHIVAELGGARVGFDELGNLSYSERVPDQPAERRMELARLLVNSFFDELAKQLGTLEGILNLETRAKLNGISEAEIEQIRERALSRIDEAAWKWGEVPDEELVFRMSLYPPLFGDRITINDAGSIVAFDSPRTSEGQPEDFSLDFIRAVANRLQKYLDQEGMDYPLSYGDGYVDVNLTGTGKKEGVERTLREHVFPELDPDKRTLIFVIGDGSNDIPVFRLDFPDHPNVTVIPVFLKHDEVYAALLPEDMMISRKENLNGSQEVFEFVSEIQDPWRTEETILPILRWKRSESRSDQDEMNRSWRDLKNLIAKLGSEEHIQEHLRKTERENAQRLLSRYSLNDISAGELAEFSTFRGIRARQQPIRLRSMMFFVASAAALAVLTVDTIFYGRLTGLTLLAALALGVTLGWPQGVLVGTKNVRALTDDLNTRYAMIRVLESRFYQGWVEGYRTWREGWRENRGQNVLVNPNDVGAAKEMSESLEDVFSLMKTLSEIMPELSDRYLADRLTELDRILQAAGKFRQIPELVSELFQISGRSGGKPTSREGYRNRVARVEQIANEIDQVVTEIPDVLESFGVKASSRAESREESTESFEEIVESGLRERVFDRKGTSELVELWVKAQQESGIQSILKRQGISDPEKLDEVIQRMRESLNTFVLLDRIGMIGAVGAAIFAGVALIGGIGTVHTLKYPEISTLGPKFWGLLATVGVAGFVISLSDFFSVRAGFKRLSDNLVNLRRIKYGPSQTLRLPPWARRAEAKFGKIQSTVRPDEDKDASIPQQESRAETREGEPLLMNERYATNAIIGYFSKQTMAFLDERANVSRDDVLDWMEKQFLVELVEGPIPGFVRDAMHGLRDSQTAFAIGPEMNPARIGYDWAIEKRYDEDWFEDDQLVRIVLSFFALKKAELAKILPTKDDEAGLKTFYASFASELNKRLAENGLAILVVEMDGQKFPGNPMLYQALEGQNFQLTKFGPGDAIWIVTKQPIEAVFKEITQEIRSETRTIVTSIEDLGDFAKKKRDSQEDNRKRDRMFEAAREVWEKSRRKPRSDDDKRWLRLAHRFLAHLGEVAGDEARERERNARGMFRDYLDVLIATFPQVPRMPHRERVIPEATGLPEVKMIMLAASIQKKTDAVRSIEKSVLAGVVAQPAIEKVISIPTNVAGILQYRFTKIAVETAWELLSAEFRAITEATLKGSVVDLDHWPGKVSNRGIVLSDTFGRTHTEVMIQTRKKLEGFVDRHKGILAQEWVQAKGNVGVFLDRVNERIGKPGDPISKDFQEIFSRAKNLMAGVVQIVNRLPEEVVKRRAAEILEKTGVGQAKIKSFNRMMEDELQAAIDERNKRMDTTSYRTYERAQRAIEWPPTITEDVREAGDRVKELQANIKTLRASIEAYEQYEKEFSGLTKAGDSTVIRSEERSVLEEAILKHIGMPEGSIVGLNIGYRWWPERVQRLNIQRQLKKFRGRKNLVRLDGLSSFKTENFLPSLNPADSALLASRIQEAPDFAKLFQESPDLARRMPWVYLINRFVEISRMLKPRIIDLAQITGKDLVIHSERYPHVHAKMKDPIDWVPPVIADLLSNAVYHGNQLDLDRPIYLYWGLNEDDQLLEIIVFDTANRDSTLVEAVGRDNVKEFLELGGRDNATEVMYNLFEPEGEVYAGWRVNHIPDGDGNIIGHRASIGIALKERAEARSTLQDDFTRSAELIQSIMDRTFAAELGGEIANKLLAPLFRLQFDIPASDDTLGRKIHEDPSRFEQLIARMIQTIGMFQKEITEFVSEGQLVQDVAALLELLARMQKAVTAIVAGTSQEQPDVAGPSAETPKKSAADALAKLRAQQMRKRLDAAQRLSDAIERREAPRKDSADDNDPTRSEARRSPGTSPSLRTVTRQMLDALAGVAFAGEAASTFSVQVRDHFDVVTQTLRAEAADSGYVLKFAGEAMSESPVHAWDQVQTAAFIQSKLEDIFEFYYQYLSHDPNEKLNFSFGFPLNETDAEAERIKGWVLDYLAMIEKLRMEYGSHVEGNILIYVTQRELENPKHVHFFSQIRGSDFAKVVELEPQTAKWDLQRFLEENRNALIYGISDYGVSADYLQHIVGFGDVRAVSAFPVALTLSSLLASESQITATLLEQLPEVFDGVVHYNGTSLEITSLALEWIESERRMAEYISQSA